MRALIFDGARMQVTDRLEVRDPGPNEVRVRVVHAGVCHSDVSAMRGSPMRTPAVLGHEGAGVVEELGANVTSVAVGDHVVISTLSSCGLCSFCSTGRPTLCASAMRRSATAPFTLDGEPVWSNNSCSVFAQQVIVKDVQSVRIPPEIPLSSACVIGCAVITGVGTVFNHARVQRGDVVVVFGLGGVGLNVLQACRIAGASRIIALDVVAEKEPLARRFGATDFIDGSLGDTVRRVQQLLGVAVRENELPEGGVDWAFDCVGKPGILRACFETTGWGGTAVLVGAPDRDAELAIPAFPLLRDRAVIGCMYGAARPHHDIPLFIELYQKGELLLDELVTRIYPLERIDQLVADMADGDLARGVLTFEP